MYHITYRATSPRPALTPLKEAFCLESFVWVDVGWEANKNWPDPREHFMDRSDAAPGGFIREVDLDG